MQRVARVLRAVRWVTLGVTLLVAPRLAAATKPQWIWATDTQSRVQVPADPDAGCKLTREFEVAYPVQSAELWVAVDFCDATVVLNGQPLLTVETYGPAGRRDVTPLLREGVNRLELRASRSVGPAAMALRCAWTDGDGQQHVVVTDRQWHTGSQEPAAPSSPAASAVELGAVPDGLSGQNRRPATIDPYDNYEQWRQALGASASDQSPSFWVAPGFEITRVRNAQAEEGSWVSMAFDPAGRLTIAREDRGLLRMTLDEDHLSVTKVELINNELQECRGLLFAYEALYAHANNSHALFQLRDTNQDGSLDEVRKLREFPGGVGHGRNDLALGPNGGIYAIHGDSVTVPTQDIQDATSPLRESRRGQPASEGFVVRTDRDGTSWKLLSAGLRNPFGIAFNPRGDAFTYDADAEFDLGTPWYRPTRVLHLISGADYGWRGVTGRWPPYFADHAQNALPTLEIGKGSPTAVAFGTGTRFPVDYQQALFILDWTYGRILAVYLAPRGAGYRAQAETFLKGRPLNVTDIAVGPDGALWIITGGRKTHSALYRLTYSGASEPPAPQSLHELACRKHADAARQKRLELEALHRPQPGALETAWPHLDSPDPTLRHAARLVVEHQPVKTWQARALAEKRATAALTVLSALARSEHEGTAPEIVERLQTFAMEDLDVSQSQLLCQAYTACLEHVPQAVMAHRQEILEQLEAGWDTQATGPTVFSPAGTNRELIRQMVVLLAALESPTLIERVITTLLNSPEQVDQFQGLYVLRTRRSGWSEATRRYYFQALNEAQNFVGGEGLPKTLAQIRTDAVATLSESERSSLTGLLAAEATTSSEPLPPPRPLVKTWSLQDVPELLASGTHSGDPERGEKVFREALCARCHRAGARGPAVGPDLTHVAGRFRAADILASILEPSQVVAESYRNVRIHTTDGRQLIGRPVMAGDFRSQKLKLALQPLDPAAVVELSKEEIEEVQEHPTSPMPAGLLDSFTAAEIQDLLAFLQRGPVASPTSRPVSP